MSVDGNYRMDSFARMQARADVAALNLLCSPQAVSRFEAVAESFSKKDLRKFLRGYRLAVATPLRELLWFVVDRADLLGLEFDARLRDWLHFHRPARGETLVSAISDQSSGLSRLCHLFEELRVTLRKAEGGLADTIAALQQCHSFSRALDESLGGTAILHIVTRERLLDFKDFLPLSVAERAFDYAERPGMLSQALDWVWGNDSVVNPIDKQFVLMAETHLSEVSLFASSKGIDYGTGKGFWFGIDLILQLSGMNLKTRPEPDFDPNLWKDWLNELQAAVQQSTPDLRWPSLTYGLAEFSPAAVKKMLSQLEVDVTTVIPKQRLATILGPDEVHLMSDSGAADAFQLDVVLTGAVAKSEGAAVRVLLLNHTVTYDPRVWVSIGIRLPQYGTLGSNFSIWYLFYKMFHRGEVFDTDVARNITAVKELLGKLEADIEVEEIVGLDSEDFLPFCVPDSYRAMRNLSRDAVEVNADLRARNSELLAGFWMTSQGYRPARVSFKRASLGKYEYDAIGVKDGECLVIEVKSADLRDDQLHSEIARLEEKVEGLRSRLPELATAIGCENEIDSVSGLFVFLGELDEFPRTDTSVAKWDYDDFVQALRDAGLPSRVTGLLDRSNIIRTIDLADLGDELFSVGLGDD